MILTDETTEVDIYLSVMSISDASVRLKKY
jgi:hypothetical protein